MSSATATSVTPAAPAPKTQRETLLTEELERLKKELAVLDRQWARKHYLGAFGLLAIPAYFYGVAYTIIVLLCTPALIAVQAYLIGVRRNECRELIAEARGELARLRGPSAKPKPSS